MNAKQPLFQSIPHVILMLALGLTPLLVATSQPNVILIISDDLNTDIEGYGGHPQAQTPHLDRLMDSGISFLQAHCVIPICAPSRASFMSGIYPHHSGYYNFDYWFENTVLNNSRMIPEHFKANGYYTLGTGKILHHHKAYQYDEFYRIADYGPYVWDGENEVAHPLTPMPFAKLGRVNGSFGPLMKLEGRDFGDGKHYSWRGGNWKGKHPLRFETDTDRDLTPDEVNGEWAAKRLAELADSEDTKPFFMTVGFLRPHTPLVVPQRFFDLFPLETLELPEILEGDAADTFLVKTREGSDLGTKMYEKLLASYDDRETALKHFVQAYLASVASVDEQIGKIIDAVDATSLRENTIIIVTSDHGWGNGQKDYIYKNALWEESTRVPLIIRAPGLSQPGTRSDTPVSLIDLYPTLVDLCGLPTDTRKNEQGRPLDGYSLRPLIEDPDTKQWNGPDAALTIVQRKNENRPEFQNYSLREKDWRYIRYHTGDEELYDKRTDPHEWHNLASNPEYAGTIALFRRKLAGQLRVSFSTP